MKTILEDNFLGYRLELNIDSANRMVMGTLTDVYPCGHMEHDSYVAMAVCADGDKFSETKGVKLVKLKLARQIHNDALIAVKDAIRCTEKDLASMQNDRDFHVKKIEGIDAVLKREFGRTVYDSTKPVKKTAVKKTTAKKTVRKSTKKK